MDLIGPQRVGTTRRYTLGPILGPDGVAVPFTGTEPVSAELRPFGGGAAVATPGVAWVAPVAPATTTSTLTLTVDDSHTILAGPGTWLLYVKATLGGEPTDLIDPTALILTSAEEADPPGSPVSLAQVKTYQSLESDVFDATLRLLTLAAVRMVEQVSGVALTRRTFTHDVAGFPGGAIRLPMRPVASVDAITYQDLGGAALAVDPSLYYSTYPRGWPAPIGGWPAARAVRVTYTAGYAADQCPETYRVAVLLAVSTWFNRSLDPGEGLELPQAVLDLIRAEAGGF